jgi:hypothetical protein
MRLRRGDGLGVRLATLRLVSLDALITLSLSQIQSAGG